MSRQRRILISMMQQVDRPDVNPMHVERMLDWLESVVNVRKLAWNVSSADIVTLMNNPSDPLADELNDEQYQTMRSCLLLMQYLNAELPYEGLCQVRINQSYHQFVHFLTLAPLDESLSQAEERGIAIMMRFMKKGIQTSSRFMRGRNTGEESGEDGGNQCGTESNAAMG